MSFPKNVGVPSRMARSHSSRYCATRNRLPSSTPRLPAPVRRTNPSCTHMCCPVSTCSCAAYAAPSRLIPPSPSCASAASNRSPTRSSNRWTASRTADTGMKQTASASSCLPAVRVRASCPSLVQARKRACAASRSPERRRHDTTLPRLITVPFDGPPPGGPSVIHAPRLPVTTPADACCRVARCRRMRRNRHRRALRGAKPQHLLHGGRYGHHGARVTRRVGDRIDILLERAERADRSMTARRHARHERLQQHRIGPAAGQRFGEPSGIDAARLRQTDGLGDRGHRRGDDRLVALLRRLPRARIAHVRDPRRIRVDQRPHRVEIGRAAAGHHRERAGLRAGHAARHRRIDPADAERRCTRRVIARGGGRNARMIDDALQATRTRIAGQQAVLAERDIAHRAAVEHAHEYRLDALRQFARRADHLRAVLHERLGLVARAIPHADPMPCRQQMPNHRRAHQSRSAKSDFHDAPRLRYGLNLPPIIPITQEAGHARRFGTTACAGHPYRHPRSAS